jgi:hypothetical protein
MGREMRKALIADDWPSIAGASVSIAQKLMKIKIPERHRLGTPWEGAWEAFQKSEG